MSERIAKTILDLDRANPGAGEAPFEVPAEVWRQLVAGARLALSLCVCGHAMTEHALVHEECNHCGHVGCHAFLARRSA